MIAYPKQADVLAQAVPPRQHVSCTVADLWSDFSAMVLPVTLQWSGKPFPPADALSLVSRWLRGGMNRYSCRAVGDGFAPCADRRDRVASCLHESGCTADRSFPLPGAAAHRSPTVIVRLPSHGQPMPVGFLALEVWLLGSRAEDEAWCPVVDNLRRLSLPRGPAARTPPVRTVSLGPARREWFCDHANTLLRGTAHGWRLAADSPWLLRRTGSDDVEALASDAVQRWPWHVAQRAYKFASLLQEDRAWRAGQTVHADQAHAVCLAARSSCAEAMSGLEVHPLLAQVVQWSERSRSTGLQQLMVGLEFEHQLAARTVQAGAAAAPWLAMLAWIGIGEGTAEGHGRVAIRPSEAVRRPEPPGTAPHPASP